jgi:hypothetical protein
MVAIRTDSITVNNVFVHTHDKLLESHGTFYNLNVLLDSASTILIFRLRTQPDAQERVATPAQAVRDPIC